MVLQNTRNKEGEIIERALGETGRGVADRIMGLIVMVVGVQFIVNGIIGIIGLNF